MKKLFAFLLVALFALTVTAQTTVVYNSANHQSTFAAFVVKDKYPTATIINIAALDSLDVDTLLDVSIADSSQLYIYITCPVVVGTTPVGSLSNEQITALGFKLLVGPDTGEVVQVGNTSILGKTASRQTWESIYMPTVGLKCNPSPFLNFLGGYLVGLKENITATSVTDTSITKTAAGWTVNAYSGKYVFIVSATTGKGVYAKIKSNTATRLIVYSSLKSYINPSIAPSAVTALTGGFVPSLTGTVIFSIVEDYSDVFYAAYALRFAETYFSDPTNLYQMDWFQKLCDKDRKAAQCRVAPYDKFYYGVALQYGKIVFDNEITNP